MSSSQLGLHGKPAVKDAEVTEKVRTTSIMARKSQVEMVTCCGGSADELGPAKSI